MNRAARRRLGVSDTVIDVVADSIEREAPSLNRMQVEAMAWVAVRRLRRWDRQVRFRPGRRVLAKIDSTGIVKGTRGVIQMVGRKRLVIHWEGRGQDMMDKTAFSHYCEFARA